MSKLDAQSPYPAIAAELVRIGAEIEEHSQILRELKKAKEHLTDDVLPKKLNEEGLSTVHVKNYGRFSARHETRVSTKGGQGPALQKWLADNGYEELIQPTVNSSTLKSFIKECIEEGRDFPDDCINMHSFERVTLTKS